MRIEFWWQRPSGHFDACTRRLVERGHSVSVMYRSFDTDAPFLSLQQEKFPHLEHVSYWSDKPDTDSLQRSIARKPDAIVVSSWGFWRYNRAIAGADEKTATILCVDTPWRRSAKQVVGVLPYRLALPRLFTHCWVAGDPQVEMVRRLGFNEGRVSTGMCCGDSDLYERGQTSIADEPFLFVGRRVRHKGLDILYEAYAKYRQRSTNPRSLTVVGVGEIWTEAEGVTNLGFIEPRQTHALMAASAALVHPARFEHWGLVLHEAARTGLPLISTPGVGATSQFLIDGANGILTQPNPESLAADLCRFDLLTVEQRRSFAETSASLGAEYGLDDWVERLEGVIESCSVETDNGVSG